MQNTQSGWLEKVKDLLQSLIKSAPVNPTSNEEKAAMIVFNKLKKAGAEVELLHKEGYDKRLNVIARIEGKNPSAGKLGLLSHLDVVPAGDTSKWIHSPFNGTADNDFIYGRGAFDCLGVVASETIAFLRLLEENFVPEGDIVLILEADEETGGYFGAKFLVDNHWDKVGVDYILNEGGGLPIPSGKKIKYTISTAEKGPCWVQWTIKGQSGHGSVPNNKENVLVTASKLIKKLAKKKFPLKISQEFKEFVDSYGLPKLLKSKLFFKMILPALQKVLSKEKTQLLESMIRMTITPTIIRGGEKENVIPDTVKVTLDARVPLMQSIEESLEMILSVANKNERRNITQKLILGHPASSSRTKTPFYNEINKTMRKIEPKTKLVPFILAGTTDSRFWRLKGSIAYGFTPVSSVMPFSEISHITHNFNERIDFQSLNLMQDFFYRISKNFQKIKRPKVIKQ